MLEPLFEHNLFLILGTLACFVAGYFFQGIFNKANKNKNEVLAKEIEQSASQKNKDYQKEVQLKSKELLVKMREDFDQELLTRRENVATLEKKISLTENSLDGRLKLIENKEKDINLRFDSLNGLQESADAKEKDLKQLIEQEKQALQKVASLSESSAKQMIFDKFEETLVHEKAAAIRDGERDIQLDATKNARYTISEAIQNCLVKTDISTPRLTTVTLPNDEMKGRIIGREGRNIRVLEEATGINIVIDNTPNIVTITGYNMANKEIARIALKALVASGGIHPKSIIEAVRQAKIEFEEMTKEEGEKATEELGIPEMHQDLLKLVGRLKYRSSYGQNALHHTKEAVLVCGSMATQLGLDPQVAKRGALLHDIGKVMDLEGGEDTHAIAGGNLARRCGEQEEVANAIEAHHEEEEKGSVYGLLVCASDAISASRPGARADSAETYVKRLEDLDKIAHSFDGKIEKSYAVQAGRELRLFVNSEKIADKEVAALAIDVRKKIEEEMAYPGHIKVTVFRQTRAVEHAK